MLNLETHYPKLPPLFSKEKNLPNPNPNPDLPATSERVGPPVSHRSPKAEEKAEERQQESAAAATEANAAAVVVVFRQKSPAKALARELVCVSRFLLLLVVCDVQ